MREARSTARWLTTLMASPMGLAYRFLGLALVVALVSVLSDDTCTNHPDLVAAHGILL